MVRADESSDCGTAGAYHHREVNSVNEGVASPMKIRMCAVCLLAASGAIGGILGLSSAANGEHTRFWRQTDYADFEKGTRKGVALRSDGWLAPAPHFAQFADPTLAYLWQVRIDSRGRLYAAGGSYAKVVRFD